jgi:hypothetical protein
MQTLEPRRADMDGQQDNYPGLSETYARVTSLTPAQCRDVIAYLVGWDPLGVDLAISVVQARELGKQTGAEG